MTVIAWDGRTLAADKMACSQSHVFTITKIAVVGGLLVGVAGCAHKIREFQDWINSDRAPEKYPKAIGDNEYFTALVISRGGLVHRYEGGSHVPMIVEDREHAIGVGRDFARAAMYLGKSAKEAVEITCLFCADCGLGVDTLTFGNP